jgi:Tfp pilus assembly major pilin PilA
MSTGIGRLHPPGRSAPCRRRQRGFSMFGLLMWAVIIAFGATIVIKVFPTVNEYWTARKALQKLADSGSTSVAEMKRSFETQKQIEYSLNAVDVKDLQFTIEGDKVKISLAYDREIEIFAPVFLLLKYEAKVTSH